MKKAFSLLELLIVLVIVAVLFGVGTVGLIRLKDTLDAEQGMNQVTSFLKSEKNKAKNNVLDEDKLRANPTSQDVFKNISNYMIGTKLVFQNSGVIEKSLCWRLLTSQWPSNITNCILIEEIPSVGGIKFSISNLGPSAGCGHVLFENLTERIVLNTATDCKINLITDTFSNPPYRQLLFYKSLGFYDVITPTP